MAIAGRRHDEDGDGDDRARTVSTMPWSKPTHNRPIMLDAHGDDDDTMMMHSDAGDDDGDSDDSGDYAMVETDSR